MNYTKGKWHIEEDNLGCKNIVVGGEEIFAASGRFTRNYNAEIGYTTGLSDEAQDLANASLIAAAPDMYEALQKLVAAYNCHYTAETMMSEGYFDNAIAAISKAEGRE